MRTSYIKRPRIIQKRHIHIHFGIVSNIETPPPAISQRQESLMEHAHGD